MTVSSKDHATLTVPRWASCTLLGLGIALAAGCPTLFPPSDNGNANTNANANDNSATGDAEIITPSTSFGISSLDPPVSVLYSVATAATDVRGFYVPVADGSRNSPAIGDRVITATNLPTGERQSFSFDPREAGVGFYRVGIAFLLNGTEDDAESSAVIQVQGSPDPLFILPAENTTQVREGETVFVSFDLRDPEGVVQWRLFVLAPLDPRDTPPDQLGTQLAVGSGNVGTFTFLTEGLEPADYQLGLSATDSGSSIANTVTNGETDRIVTIPGTAGAAPVLRVVDASESQTPTIAITAPATADVGLYLDDPYTIRFAGQVFGPDAEGAIDVFYDTDNNANNGFSTIQADLPVSTTTASFPAGLPEGTYYIGATIRDGVNAPRTVYAAGRLRVIRTVTLDVTAPSSALPVTLGSSVRVAWTTNAPSGSGTVDVFAQTIDASGNPFGAEISLLIDQAISTTTTNFSRTTPGLFRITVRLALRDGAQAEEAAPATVRFSSLPAVLWLGSLADLTSRVDGAIFEGVNFEDNAGSSFTTAGDLDGDDLDEFVIASRYGKPFFLNPSGVGPGEGYIIFGRSGSARLAGSYHLNSVGTSLLRGVTLTGIPTVDDSDETEGLGPMLLVPDTDDDDLGEILFAFPQVHSAPQDALEAEGQFDAGGVVILSSDNSLLRTPGVGQPVIKLDQVGRRFSDQTITPAGVATCLADRRVFRAGNPTGTPPTVDACITGTDGVLDTLIGPSVGFIRYLAPACWERFGFTEIGAGTAPTPGICTSQSVQAECIEAGLNSNVFTGLETGSGFYPATATPLEPHGARILGFANGDGFGASVTSNRTGATGTPGDLIISSPNRTAAADEAEGSEISDSGVGYIFSNRHLWGIETFFIELMGLPPPTPNQYVIGASSHCGAGRAGSLGSRRITGDSGDTISSVLGITDFNRDGRDDFVVGAPTAASGQGKVYISFRREPGGGGLEGPVILSKLALGSDDPERLDGMLIVTNALDSFGASLAGEFDFNNDKIPDMVIGSPNANNGAGEVVILFGGTGVVSPADGISVSTLLNSTRTGAGAPVAARIQGNPLDINGQFGFNIANAGDIDKDGFDDLIVAAPNATPRFDSNPNDGTDAMTALGVDLNFDGVRDQVPGADELTDAGLVYLIFGSNRLDQIKICQGTTTACSTALECATDVPCVAGDFTINVNQLGKSQLRGVIVAGRHASDHLGGGDAGDASLGGIPAKEGKGRSLGLGSPGDVDGDGLDDILMGSILADPRRNVNTDVGVQNGGEAYLIYGSTIP